MSVITEDEFCKIVNSKNITINQKKEIISKSEHNIVQISEFLNDMFKNKDVLK